MTDSERFYCAACMSRLECRSCELEECPKCGRLIVDDKDWIREAEMVKRTEKVDAEMAEWINLNSPRMAPNDQRP